MTHKKGELCACADCLTRHWTGGGEQLRIKKVETVIHKKGTKLYCRQCLDHITTFAVDANWGLPLEAELFEPKAGQGPWLNSDRCVCRVCGTGWWTGHEFNALADIYKGTWTGDMMELQEAWTDLVDEFARIFRVHQFLDFTTKVLNKFKRG